MRYEIITTNAFKNWLLIYERVEEQLVLILLNTGSHSDLF